MKNTVLFGFAEMDITPSFNVQTIGFNRKEYCTKKGCLPHQISDIVISDI